MVGCIPDGDVGRIRVDDDYEDVYDVDDGAMQRPPPQPPRPQQTRTAFDIFKSLCPPGLFTGEQLDSMGYNNMGSKFEDVETELCKLYKNL